MCPDDAMSDRPVPNVKGPPAPAAGAWRPWLTVAALLGLVATVYAAGLHHHLSLVTLAEHREALRGFVEGHLLLALAAYVLLYVAIVALSVPGAAVMSIAGGFLFGWMLSAPVAVLAATAGAVIVFQIVRTSFGVALAARAGPLVQKLSAGFAADAFHFLLFLRLAPVFPFFIVNVVAGLARVPLTTFILATGIGMLPASIVFALLGAGLDGIITARLAARQACVAATTGADCQLDLDAANLVTGELLLAFFGLGVLALVPVVLRRRRLPLS